MTTDKMPAKDFNAIFKNDELAKEFVLLFEKSRKKEIIQYSKETLMEISKNPLCKISPSEFNSRLEKANLSANIIHSLQRKNSLNDEELNSKEYNRYKSNPYNSKYTNKPRENIEFNRDMIQRNYRPSKMYDSFDNSQSWRNDKGGNSSNDYQDNRNSRPRKYDRYNSRNNYSRHDYEEKEPEWFSNGPDTMDEFIDLKGFDDDINCDNGGDKENSKDLNNRKSESNSFKNILENSKNENISIDDLSSLSSMLNMDSSTFLNSSNASLLDKDINDFPLHMFHDLNSTASSTSRAGKWFKNKSEVKEQDPVIDSNPGKTSIMDLFQNKNIDLGKFPQSAGNNLADIKVDMSKAKSLAELEASLINSSDKVNQSSSKIDAAILSKLCSLAGNQDFKENVTKNQSQNAFASYLDKFSIEQIEKSFQQSDQPQKPMSTNIAPVPNCVDVNEINKNILENFLKMNHPMNPFPFAPDNNLQFNNGNISHRPPLHFPPQYHPELAHQFVPPNPFMPHLLPNLPYHPMMGNPHNISVPLPPQYMPPPYNPMIATNQGQVFKSPPMAPDDSMTDKLLKNSKFTPTSVYRKLKGQQDQQNKAKLFLSNPSNFGQPQVKQEIINQNAKSNEHLLSSFNLMDNPLNVQRNNHVPSTNEYQFINNGGDNSSVNIESLWNQFNLNLHTNNQKCSEMSNPQAQMSAKPNAISLKPNDIFNVMNENNSDILDLPPLPLKNALKVEDIENF